MNYNRTEIVYPGLIYNNKLNAFIVVITTIIFFAVWLAPSEYSQYQINNFTAWHVIAESISVAIAFSIFTFMWHARVADNTRNRLNILSMSFLVVAVLDIAHLLTFKGMPRWIIQSGNGSAIIFWIFSRYAAVIGLIILVSPLKAIGSKRIPVKLIFLAVIIFTAIPFYIFGVYPDVGRLFIVPGKGLFGLRIGLEWGLICLYMLALVINNYTKRDAKFYDAGAVIIAIHLSILSELCFTLYSNATGVFDVLGHIYKVASYIYLYSGIAVISLKLPYKELARKDELLNQIASNIKQMVLLSTSDKRRIFYVNPAFEEITGYRVDSLLKEPAIWYELIHHDDLDKVRKIMIEKSGKAFTHEFRIFDANSNVVWISESVYPITEENGSVNRVTSVCEDVTQNKKLQSVVVEREKLLNSVLNSIPYMIGYWGKDLRSKFSNDAYRKWFNRSEKQLSNVHVIDLLGEDLYRKNYKYIRAALDGKSQQFERTFRLNGGDEKHTIIHYEPGISDGEVVGFYVAISDVTEIKNAQKELRISEDRLLRSQTLGHIGSWEIDLKSGDAWWSSENYDIYGIKKETVIDRHTALDMVHPDDRNDLLNVWELSLRTQSTYSHEHRIITPGNETKYVWEFAEISYDENQKPHILAGCTQDITERKTAELERISLQNQLMQSQKMESIGHLTGGVAHDFNNMLAAILGYTELLKQIIPPLDVDNERVGKYITEILTAGNRAKELISQMLVFSRYSPDAQTEAPVILVQPVLKEVVSLLRSSIPSTISINYHISVQSLHAKIHPVQLHQILLNLAINARDSIQEYGNIDISLNMVTKTGNCKSCHKNYSGEFIDIAVCDNGEGISNDLFGKIFDPFYTTKEVGKGTGMGLSVVHGVVHSLGGHINLVSEIDKGSEFHIFLPSIDSTAKYQGALVKSSKDDSDKLRLLDGLRVMVVDDEEAITTLLLDLLELHGALVTACNHSPDALSQFTTNPDAYDIVITDETMPDMSGFDMSMAMLENRPNLPIILCTGYSNKITREITRDNGIAGFMLKPIKADELIDEIIRIKSI